MAHCDEALRLIYIAIKQYQDDNQGKNPESLQHLVDLELITPWELVCPVSPYAVGDSSFGYRGADLDSRAPKELILAFDKRAVHNQRRNVLTADGQIQNPPEGVFDQMIKKDNEIRQKKELAIIEFNRYRVDE
ncbi:MAG: hypothetical protein JEZ07_17325 [Phycisphaerae bacterium]|nr:hypothetical protein [Phycisphaerae bacterium]